MLVMIRLLKILIGCYQSDINPKCKFSLQTCSRQVNATKSTLMETLTIKCVGEDATDAADATPFCTTAASTRNKTLSTKKTTLPFVEKLLRHMDAALFCNN